MLWLAYAQGWSHEEIASAIGVKTASLKEMLHRARHRLAALLNPEGDHDPPSPGLRPGQAPHDCPNEHAVVNAVLAGRWPHGCDEALVAHAGQCMTCREVAQGLGAAA